VYTWNQISKKGESVQDKTWEKVTPEMIYTFSYTSGTTGEPKGAMLSHKNLAVTIQVIINQIKLTSKDKHLNYLPMAHIMERFTTLCMLICGASICIFSGDVKKLKEDLGIFKPTIFLSVPRLYNKFYDAIQSKIAEAKGSMKGKLVDMAIETKLENLKNNGEVTHSFYDAIIFQKMKDILGGNVRLMITGSAPLNKDVADMLKICMCCSMLEAYGQTEGTGAEFGMKIEDTESGHVGGIMPHNEFKLVDVPEMNYTSKDVNPNTGILEPRGEIWVRGAGIIPGYYKKEKKNQETFTKDGWLKSGDIGKIDSINNRLVIIDRKKNIFKLSQGEYIAPEKLEGNYKTCTPLISDIFIYGDSFQNFLLSVVTVEKENILPLARLVGMSKNVPEDSILSHSEFEEKVLNLFKEKAKEVKFNKLEIPKGIVFNQTPFADLGLLTTSFKPKRQQIKDHFKERLENKYKIIN
jgi:long-chain acyl-CoA synthetase